MQIRLCNIAVKDICIKKKKKCANACLPQSSLQCCSKRYLSLFSFFFFFFPLMQAMLPSLFFFFSSFYANARLPHCTVCNTAVRNTFLFLSPPPPPPTHTHTLTPVLSVSPFSQLHAGGNVTLPSMQSVCSTVNTQTAREDGAATHHKLNQATDT